MLYRDLSLHVVSEIKIYTTSMSKFLISIKAALEHAHTYDLCQQCKQAFAILTNRIFNILICEERTYTDPYNEPI